MEELTSVVCSAEAKQRQRNDADNDVGRGGEQGRKKFLQPERREDKAGLSGARDLRSGGSVAVRWRAATQLSRARDTSVRPAG
jgi:hypothetical protein